MKNLISQAHVKWECKYHVVIFPKYRKKVLYGKIRRKIGGILRDLCRQKGVQLGDTIKSPFEGGFRGMLFQCNVAKMAVIPAEAEILSG